MRNKNKKFLVVVHPLLFALFPVLFLYAHNIGEVTFKQTIVPASVILIFAIFFWLILLGILRNVNKAALSVSLFIIFFFSYGSIHSVLNHFSLRGYNLWGWRIGINTYLLPLWTIFLTVGFYFLVRTRKQLLQLTKIMNVISICLVSFSAVNIVVYVFKARNGPKQVLSQNSEQTFVDLKKPAFCPDIYYIVLDEYARSDVLKRFLNYDNSELIDYLTGKGFYVAGQSRTPYRSTDPSLRASLNFEHVHAEGDRSFMEYKRKRTKGSISNNKVFGSLKKIGYNIVSFSSGYTFTECPDTDFYLAYNRLSFNEFGNELLNISPLIAIPQIRASQFGAHRKRILYALEHLPGIPDRYRPFFVFAHILCPHAPYVFGPNGEEISTYESFTIAGGEDLVKIYSNFDGYSRMYCDQITFVNRKIMQVVEQILAKTTRKPIIIIQSDHGSRWLYNKENPNPLELEAIYCILNAVYFPDGNYSNMHKSISPVNTFRVVFNQYFGTDYQLLPDESYVRDGDKFHKLSEILHAESATNN